MMPTNDPRSQLCKLLENYARRRPEAAATTARFLRFVRRNPLCAERSSAQGHLTASAWLLNPAGDKALLCLHRKLGRWLQTGGHADGDCNLLRVALREATEESGIPSIRPLESDIFDADIHLIPARESEPAHLHYDLRFLLQAPQESFRCSTESLQLAWWSAEDFAAGRELLDASVLRMAAQLPGIGRAEAGN